jgi:hypothetical protein
MDAAKAPRRQILFDKLADKIGTCSGAGFAAPAFRCFHDALLSFHASGAWSKQKNRKFPQNPASLGKPRQIFTVQKSVK